MTSSVSSLRENFIKLAQIAYDGATALANKVQDVVRRSIPSNPSPNAEENGKLNNVVQLPRGLVQYSYLDSNGVSQVIQGVPLEFEN